MAFKYPIGYHHEKKCPNSVLDVHFGGSRSPLLPFVEEETFLHFINIRKN
jgi:hypothetical protein